jgi:hypothetical protein
MKVLYSYGCQKQKYVALDGGTEQERLLNRKRKPKALSLGELEPVHVSGLLSDALTVTTVRRKKLYLRKNAPPGLWSQEAVSDNEYKLYNPGDRCLWEIMLEFFDQKLMDGNGQLMIKCRNCNNSCPDGFRLSELHPEDREHTETEEGKKKVKLNSWLCVSQNNQFSPTVTSLGSAVRLILTNSRH